jgi:hypothetical protein
MPSRRGVIYAVGPSYLDPNLVWAGTDDGLIHVTRDGGRSWSNVTPSQLSPWAKVSIVEASHFDVNTAYAAINTLRLDDLRPYIYRTKDGGRSWHSISAGLPAGATVNSVKEDPLRRGMLFAATERSVHVSFDDGDNWQSLRLNLPATSVRDLVVKDDDLVIATHGRGFWILDDISPLRQVTPDIARASLFLFRPGIAWRFRWNKNTDTPLPPDEPAAPNPPDGVQISYLLGPNTTGPVTLEIIETASGTTIRRYSSEDPDDVPVAGRNMPDYWIRPVPRLSAAPGLHRFVWDLRYTPPAVTSFEYPIAAIFRNTPKEPRGMFVNPGTYQVRLTAGGRSVRQAVAVRMDPRVRMTAADLTLQLRLSKSIDDMLRQLAAAQASIRQRQAGAPAAEVARLTAVAAALTRVYAPLPGLFSRLQEVDARPTAATEAAVADALRVAAEVLASAGRP